MAKTATRMPVTHLTSDDLAAHPIWEYCTNDEGVEGQDETWVRPLADKVIPRRAWSLQVAADFELRDGSQFDGIVDVTTVPQDDVARVLGADALSQPGAIVFVNSRRVFVPTSLSSDRQAAAEELVVAFARDAASIFPIKYTLRTLVRGESQARTGVLVRFD